VIHLAAIAFEKGKNTYEKINTQGTVNVVEAAKKAGVRRFINMSQNGADSHSPYRFLKSKGSAQDYVAASGLPWTALRPSVIWGPQDEFSNVQARLIGLTPIVFPIVGDGSARFQPIYVGDVVETIVRCLHDPTTIGQSYEIGGPEVLTYEEIVKRVLAARQTHRFLFHVPLRLLYPPVIIMQTILPRPPVSATLLDLLAVPNVVADNALVSKFNLTPRAFVPENLTYMRDFTIGTTINKFLGRGLEEQKIRDLVDAPTSR
jgi:NADH dehydrogenase